MTDLQTVIDTAIHWEPKAPGNSILANRWYEDGIMEAR